MVLPFLVDIWRYHNISNIQRTITTDALVFYDSVRIVYNLPILPRTTTYA